MTQAPPVVIVGAGPSGLVLAIDLLRRGVPVRILEKHANLTTLTQATSVKSRTLDILESLGLIDAFYARGIVIRKFRFLKDADHFAEVDFALADGPHRCVLSLPETETVAILCDEVARLGGGIEFETTFQSLTQHDHYVDVRIDSPTGPETLTASWVVGADGYHSKIRDAINAHLEGEEFPELWGAVDAHIDNWSAPDGVVDLYVDPVVVAPFPIADFWRVIVGPCDRIDDPVAEITNRLQAVAPEARPVMDGPMQFFHNGALLADRFAHGRVFLVGDAAHATNPMDGHGMNIGIQDAHNLGWKLALAWRGLATEALLTSYQTERREVDATVVDIGIKTNIRLMNRSGQEIDAMIETLADAGQKRLAALAGTERIWGYSPSPILPAAPDGQPQRAGALAPHIEGLQLAGQTVSLADLMHHTGFTVLVLSPKNAALAEVAKVAQSFPDIRVHPVSDGQDDRGPGTLYDRLGAIAAAFAVDGPTMIVIRPDHHIGLSAAPSAPDLERYFSAMMLSNVR